MKLCFVTNIYPPTSIGGPGEVVYNLQKYFLEQGAEAYVFTCGEASGGYPYTIRTHGGKRLFPILSPFKYRELRKIRFDILNFHLESGMGIAPFSYFFRKPKVVTTLHSEHLTESKATKNITFKGSQVFSPSLAEWAVKYFLVPLKLFGTYLDIAVSEQIIAVSEKTKADYLTHSQIPKEKVSVIYNGVDSEKFSPRISGDSIRRDYSLNDSPLILTVGSSKILKGMIFALYALSEIVKISPKVKLMVIGIDAKYRERMLPILNSLRIQDNVILVEPVPNYEMPCYYSSSDIVLLPSLSENFPIVALEAMSSGKPLVASRVGGIPEIVNDNETGILIDPANIGQMVEALLRLLETPSLKTTLGRNGRRIVEERFDWKKIGQLYLKEFERLM
jgi:glycosyltransferase involved in cell wall biosynthesis